MFVEENWKYSFAMNLSINLIILQLIHAAQSLLVHSTDILEIVLATKLRRPTQLTTTKHNEFRIGSLGSSDSLNEMSNVAFLSLSCSCRITCKCSKKIGHFLLKIIEWKIEWFIGKFGKNLKMNLSIMHWWQYICMK